MVRPQPQRLASVVALALKLNTVMDAARKAGASVPAPAPPAATASAPAPAASAPAKPAATIGAGLKSGPTFEAIQAAIARDGPTLVKAVGGVITFDITSPAARFTIDLKSGSGSFVTGDAPAKADLTITVSDEDFSQMAAGKLNAQQASRNINTRRRAVGRSSLCPLLRCAGLHEGKAQDQGCHGPRNETADGARRRAEGPSAQAVRRLSPPPCHGYLRATSCHTGSPA